MKNSMLLTCTAVLAFSVGAAAAQDAGKAKTPPAPATAESIVCSKQADAKGLHGQARRDFRSKCKRDLVKASKSKK